MKKILLTSGALALLLSAASANAAVFDGWNVGAFLGWQRTKNELELGNLKKSNTFNGFPVGIFAGWSKSAPQSLYGGFEVSLGYGGTSGTKNIFNGAVPGTKITAGKLDYKQTRKFFVEFTPKLGWNFGNQIAYVLLGLRGTQIEHEFSFPTRTTVTGESPIPAGTKFTSKDFAIAVAPGLGYEHKFNDHLSAGVEYRYVFEGSKEPKDLKGLKVSNKAHDIRVRLAYSF